jgi:hypothetical protein
VVVYWLSAMDEILVCGHDLSCLSDLAARAVFRRQAHSPGGLGQGHPAFVPRRVDAARRDLGEQVPFPGALRLAALGGCRAGAVSMRAYSATTPGLIASGVVASLVVVVQLADRGVRPASRARTRGRVRDRCAAAAYR